MYSYSHFKKTLPSGLRFVVVDIPCLHRVVTTMFIKAGSAYESGGTNGLSHFLEHILLRGPEQYPNSIEFWQALESSGLSLGARAFKEFTYFSLDSISSALPKAIETLFQFLLSPRFNKDEVESERQITLEEALESLNAQGINVDVDDIASKLLWPNHPLGMTILGPAQNIKKFKIRDLKNYLQTFYQPDNMVLCIAGAVGNRERLEKLVNKHSSSLKGKSDNTVLELFEGQKVPQFSFTKNDSRSQVAAQVCFRALPYSDPHYTILQVLNTILGNSGSSRLAINLLERRGLVYEIYSRISPFSITGTLDINFSVSPGKLVEVVREILEEARLTRETISRKELNRAQVLMERNLMFSLDNPGNLSDIFGLDLLLGKFKKPEEKLAEIKRVTIHDVQSLAQKVFSPENLNLIVVGPYTEGQENRARGAVSEFKQ